MGFEVKNFPALKKKTPEEQEKSLLLCNVKFCKKVLEDPVEVKYFYLFY